MHWGGIGNNAIYQSCSILVVQHFLRHHSLPGQNIQSISPLAAKCGGTVLVKVRHLTQIGGPIQVLNSEESEMVKLSCN